MIDYFNVPLVLNILIPDGHFIYSNHTYGLLSHDVATAKLRLTFSIARLSNALDV